MVEASGSNPDLSILRFYGFTFLSRLTHSFEQIEAAQPDCGFIWYADIARSGTHKYLLAKSEPGELKWKA